MKKILMALLVIAFLLSFVACGGDDNGPENGSTAEITTADSTTDAPQPKDEFTFEKGADGGYVLVSFSTNDENPHKVILPQEHEGLAVTAIGKDFARASGAVSAVVIPDSVTTIADGAFAECTSLEEAVMSKSIVSIGSGAFMNCALLGSIELPWNITLGEGAFAGCDSLDREVYIPKENETMNILMVGNSFCYYYPDELFGLAKEAGIEMNICNVYYSGCSIETHYNWWQKGESNYQFFIYNEHGRRKIDNCDLETCLSAYEWDVISIQDGSTAYRKGGVSGAISSREPGLTELLKLFKQKSPNADLYWHHTWVLQVGFDRNGYAMVDAAQQKEEYKDKCVLTKSVVTKHGLDVIPSGEAWQIARADERIGDTLCMADCQHDGEEGGGQYLNACVWFEKLTGRSCVGNPFRPPYDLSEEKVAALQEAAHKAVAEYKP